MVRSIALAVVAALSATALYFAMNGKSLQQGEVEDIVRAYILENPEILPEAIENLRIKQTKELVAAAGPALYGDTGAVKVGPEKASVTIVEFYDYQCGFCRRALGDIERILETDKDVNVLFRQLPVRDQQGESYSYDSGLAALAAERQTSGDFLAFHKALYDSPSRLTVERILTLASQSGYDAEQMQRDMNDPLLGQAINKNRELAAMLGLRGTPGYVIGDQIVPGAEGYERLMEAVKAARA